MKNNKCPVDVDIGIEAIEEGDTAVLKALQISFNKCLEEQKIPAKWSNDNIVLMHKKGGIINFSNYRPICVLSHIYKNPYQTSLYKIGYKWINYVMEKCVEYNKPIIHSVSQQKLFTAKWCRMSHWLY